MQSGATPQSQTSMQSQATPQSKAPRIQSRATPQSKAPSIQSRATPQSKASSIQSRATPQSKASMQSGATHHSKATANTLPSVVHLVKHKNGVTEWLLPPNLSQSQVLGQRIGSNACTIISVLNAFNLSREAVFPETTSAINKVACYFRDIMIKGNKTPAQGFTPPADEKKMGTIWIFVYYAVYGSGRGRCRDFLVLKWGEVLICKYGI